MSRHQVKTLTKHPEPAEPVVTPQRLIGYLALVLGMFMAILDIQIVSASLSEIQAGLSASIDEISWVQTSYLIAEVIMIPLSGFLSRALSTRILFVGSAAGFTMASVLCATATSIDQMIVYRAIQGFIGGGMIPSTFAASYTIFPKRFQSPVMALVGLVVTLAPTIGPTLGGYLTDAFSWHWLFLINVVPGVIATSLAWILVDFDEPQFDLLNRFDYFGLFTMAVFLGSLEYVLEEGQRDDWFASSTIAWLSVIAAVSAAAFFWRVCTAEEPIVDLTAFENRNFAVGSLFTFVLGIGLYGMTYLYPLFLQGVRGYNALQVGETVFVTGMFMFVAAPVVGVLGRNLDPRLVISCGFLCFAVSCFELHPITAQWGFDQMFIPQALRGMALMMCIVPINTMALGTLPPERIKNASGLFNLTRNLGGAVGLAGINTILSQRWDLHMSRLRDHVTWGRHVAIEQYQGMSEMMQGNLGSDAQMAALKKLAMAVRHQAQVMAFSDVFLIMAVLFVCLLVLIPFVERARGGGDAAPAH